MYLTLSALLVDRALELKLDIILYASQVVVASYSPIPWFGGEIPVDSREWDREWRQQQVELL